MTALTGYLECWDGTTLRLPTVCQWRFSYGMGDPCDSFSVTCLWDGTLAQSLPEANRFQAVWNGETVFTGVVDECESAWEDGGTRLTVEGRGMAALLLDNEAVGSDYQVATLEDILRDHVAPYGISVAQADAMPAVSGFSVSTGSSEWQVLDRFARCYGGITPRFDRLGRLVLTAPAAEITCTLTANTALTALVLREKRYGRYDRVLVRDTAGQKLYTVVDQDFSARGGLSRKVLTMPNKTGYEAMRYNGAYQLRQSAREARMLEASLTALFPAWPGACVRVEDAWPGCAGDWRVEEMTCGWNGQGTYSTLFLSALEGGTL